MSTRRSRDPERRQSSAQAAISRRRAPIALLFSLIVCVSLVLWFGFRRAPQRIERSLDRNVLLITIDTLRADALGVTGGRAATPNLDRLAASGARFTNAHAHAVVTLPSHASILTGLYPFGHGVRDNSGYRLRAGVPTLATRTKSLGYRTAAFVGAFPLDIRFGLNAGFDLYDDRYGDTNRVSDLLMPERRADAVVQSAIRWIESQSQHWFVWVHLYDPHAPYRPPAPFDGEYASDPYAGEVAFTDYALGPLFEAARRSGTPLITIVTADHGESFGSHGEDTHGLFAYEATLRVPLIVSIPGTERAPQVVDRPVRHVDIVPTVLDALAQTVEGVAGRSLLPLLEGSDEEDRPSYFEAVSAALNRGWAPLTGAIVGHEKYIDLPLPELYDLSVDPSETANQLPGRADRARALRSRLAAFGDIGVAAGESRQARGASAERLLALGYVSGAAPIRTGYTEADDPKRLVEIDRQLQNGVALFQAGRLREALNTFEALTRARPDMALAYVHAAYIKWEMGDTSGAIAELEAARLRGATAPDVDSQLGIYLAEAGNPARALSVLAGAATSPSPDPEALNAVGIARARSNDPVGAIQAFHRVLDIDPTNAAALQNVGTVYLQQGDSNSARDAFTRAIDLDPALARAYNGLGVVEMRSGRRAQAIAAWERAVALDARQFDTLFNLGVTLVDAGEGARARPYLEKFATTAPRAQYRRDLEDVRRLLGR